MAVRYYLSRIIGSGTSEDPYRPKVVDLKVGQPSAGRYLIPFDATNQPRFAWAFCWVDAGDHSAMLGDAETDAFPNYSLDTLWGDVPANIRNAILTRMENRGIDTSQITLSWTIRQILNLIGQYLESRFDIDRWIG